MKSFKFLLYFSFICLLILFSVRTRATETTEKLGQLPICEPSAVASIFCSSSDGNCLLVGNNETDNFLFSYPIQAGNLQVANQQELSLRGSEINDIEAIAKLNNQKILIVGSHSRNKKCEIKKNRQRLLQVQVSNDGLKAINKLIKTDTISSKTLFTQEALQSNPVLRSVAQVIDEAEQLANQAQANEGNCEGSHAFNIEGAVGVLKNGSEDVWLGLRSPLIFRDGKDWAILLKLKNLNQLQFNEVALIDLEGRGVRELTRKGDFIWGIAGGPEDGKDNFIFWKFPIQQLQSNATIKPGFVQSLPISSEGLAIVKEKAYVFIDGDTDKSDTSCKVPGKFIEIPLESDG